VGKAWAGKIAEASGNHTFIARDTIIMGNLF